MSFTSQDNSRSKELLLDAMDCAIASAAVDGIGIEFNGGLILVEADPGLIAAMIMNRNRVARFLKMPTRDFRKEREGNEVNPPNHTHGV